MKSHVFKEHDRDDMTKIHIDIYETLIIGARSNPPELVMLRFLLMWIPKSRLVLSGVSSEWMGACLSHGAAPPSFQNRIHFFIIFFKNSLDFI
jgi:hypothetical protein